METYIKKGNLSEILKWDTHNFKQHGKYREVSFILSAHCIPSKSDFAENSTETESPAVRFKMFQVFVWLITLVEICWSSSYKHYIPPKNLTSRPSRVTIRKWTLSSNHHLSLNFRGVSIDTEMRGLFILRQANGSLTKHKNTKLKKFNYFLLSILKFDWYPWSFPLLAKLDNSMRNCKLDKVFVDIWSTNDSLKCRKVTCFFDLFGTSFLLNVSFGSTLSNWECGWTNMAANLYVFCRQLYIYVQ